ncbi:MAG: hypothetical protein J6K48_14730 [Lachnospiraceae bacterium]|nr:hypothetical protein [Lachnospiraceae bacterium]
MITGRLAIFFITNQGISAYIYNTEDDTDVYCKVLDALGDKKYVKSDQSDQNIISFIKEKRTKNLEKSTLSAL